MKKVRDYNKLVFQLEALSKEIPGLNLERLGVVRVEKTHYDFYFASMGMGNKEICLSGGIHGNEPAGVEAVLTFIKRVRNDGSLLTRFHFTLFPCNNPFGYEYDRRENGKGLDLNRQFGKARPPVEVRMIRGVLEGMNFDLSMEFHEDVDTEGYYLYEICTNTKFLMGEEIIKKVSERWPINLRAIIEGAPSRGGVINPEVAATFFQSRVSRTHQWPKAVWLYKNGARHCITSETPVSHAMSERVEMHLTALDVALKTLE